MRAGVGVAVTPAIDPSMNGGHHLLSHHDDDVVMIAQLWSGPTYASVAEGTHHLLRNGFAVFEVSA